MGSGLCSASDAPTSNRASETYGEEALRVLHQGIDFLELSFPGKPSAEVLEELERLKALAQSPDSNEQSLSILSIGGESFVVKDRGAGLFGFVLQSDRYLIKVRGRRGKKLPLAFVQVRSDFLRAAGTEEAADLARAIVERLGVIEGEATVSRIDQMVDFTTSADLEEWDRSAWVTRAAHKQSHSIGDRFSGWSVGLKGPIGFRLYDKTLEIEGRNTKTDLPLRWLEAGWFPGDRVWRAEFQLRRASLAQFGLRTVPEVLAALPSLWAYLTNEWLRLVLVNSVDDNRARWPLHPFWTQLQKVSWGTADPASARRIYKPSSGPNDRWIVQQGTAVLTTVMARDGILDPDEALLALRSLLGRDWQEQELWEGAPADQLLLEKALLKERKYGTFKLAKLLGRIPGEVTREPGQEG